MFENKFVSLPSHLKTIEPMEVHRGAGTMCNTKTSKVISRTDPMILTFLPKYLLLSKIIHNFATEMMAWCYHNVDKLNRNYGTIGSNSQDGF